ARFVSSPRGYPVVSRQLSRRAQLTTDNWRLSTIVDVAPIPPARPACFSDEQTRPDCYVDLYGASRRSAGRREPLARPARLRYRPPGRQCDACRGRARAGTWRRRPRPRLARAAPAARRRRVWQPHPYAGRAWRSAPSRSRRTARHTERSTRRYRAPRSQYDRRLAAYPTLLNKPTTHRQNAPRAVYHSHLYASIDTTYAVEGFEEAGYPLGVAAVGEKTRFLEGHP